MTNSIFTNDGLILLTRALQNKSITCFGIDGFGLYGFADMAETYQIKDIELLVNVDSTYLLVVKLDGYQASKCGHICTDNNFKLSFNSLLTSELIETDCWQFAPIELQQADGVVLQIDITKLLQ